MTLWKLIARFIVNGVAIWAAAELVTGVSLTSEPAGIALVVLVFAIINALLKPIAVFLGFPFIILTLGLFTLVINAGLLALTAGLTEALTITGFWPAIWGALVVSIVSWFLGTFLGTRNDQQHTQKS